MSKIKQNKAVWVFNGEKFVCNKCKQEALFFKNSKEELGELTNYCPYCGKPMWNNELLWKGSRLKKKAKSKHKKLPKGCYCVDCKYLKKQSYPYDEWETPINGYWCDWWEDKMENDDFCSRGAPKDNKKKKEEKE